MANIPFAHAFATTPLTAPFHIPKTAWLAANPPFANLAVGAMVFSPALPPRGTAPAATPRPSPAAQPPLKVLLVQRAASDFAPHVWEVPGGACEDGTVDRTLLAGVGRELYEEAGLRMVRAMAGVGGVHSWEGAGAWCKLTFWVEVDGEGTGYEENVKLDPAEHQAYVWASEEEVKAQRVGHLELRFMEGGKEILLDGFRARREAERQLRFLGE